MNTVWDCEGMNWDRRIDIVRHLTIYSKIELEIELFEIFNCFTTGDCTFLRTVQFWPRLSACHIRVVSSFTCRVAFYNSPDMIKIFIHWKKGHQPYTDSELRDRPFFQMQSTRVISPWPHCWGNIIVDLFFGDLFTDRRKSSMIVIIPMLQIGDGLKPKSKRATGLHWAVPM